jgi:hypothetical protein
MDNFDLKQFLVENKTTTNSKRLNENQSPNLTNDEKIYLENKIEEFLNSSLFNSEILDRDSEDFEPSLEEQAIQFIIKSLQDRISYY